MNVNVPDLATYLALDTEERLNTRINAAIAADDVGRRIARLYAAEVALAIRTDYPDAVQVTFDIDHDVDGSLSAGVVSIGDAAHRSLWHQDDPEDDPELPDYNDDSTVRDLLANLAGWDEDYDGTGVTLELPPTP